MSFGSTPASDTPTVAGITAAEVSSNQKAIPLRWFCGLDWSPVNWIVSEVINPEYIEKKQKVGKKTQTVGYEIFGSIAGIACVGLLDQITAIESANEVIWTGSITRPDDPGHPDYWRATIVTGYGTFYIYWGRRDQPVDDILLSGLGTAHASLAHPAYRGQVLVVINRYSFGSSETVPSTRILGRRVPQPALGTFAPQRSYQGESLPAALLELATNSLFGAGIPTDHFTASQWEAFSAAVIAQAGCHSPFLDRERPLREVIKEAFNYFDGWARIEQAKIVPGLFPHDGTVPSSIPELSHHDFVGSPEISSGGFSREINSVRVKYRDSSQKMREDSVGETARGNAKARHRTQPVEMNALWIIDNYQAGAYAAEAARTAAWGDSSGSFDVRGPKAVKLDGNILQAGDNFQLDYLPLSLDQVSRVKKRIEPYRGPVSLEYVGERGVFPLPYRAPASLAPDLGDTIPTVVANQRIFELSAPLAGTNVGIHVAILAKRPASGYENFIYISGHGVVGFNLWYSADNTTFDSLGSQSTWGVRAVVRELYNAVAGTVKVTIDGDNLDTYKMSPRSAEDQADDTLLLIIGNEVMSVGSISIAGSNWDMGVLRSRQETSAASGAVNDVAWLILRSDLVRFAHRRFIGLQTRYFKLQPYTSSRITDLADVTSVSYTFSDQRPAIPTGLTATIGSGKAVNLKWSPAASSRVNEYSIYRATGSLFADEVKIAQSSDPEYTDVRVTLGTAYRYRVTALTLDEIESDYSASVDATPSTIGSSSIDHTLPAAAGDMTKTSEGTYLSDDGKVVSYMTFSIPVLPARAVGQNLLYRRYGSSEWLVASQLHNTAITSLQIDDLNPAIIYEVGLQPFNFAGDVADVTITGHYTAPGKLTAPAAPTGLTAVAGTGKLISLWCNANSERDLGEYRFLRNTTNNSSTAILIGESRSNRFNDSEVVLGTLYYYWVQAVNDSEQVSSFSSVASATAAAVPDAQVDQTVPGTPAAPTFSSEGTYNSGDGTVFSYMVLAIAALTTGAKYQNVLWRRTGSTDWAIAAQENNTSSTTVPIDDLSPGISYDFALQERSFSGVPSAISSVFTRTAKVKDSPPGAPSGLAIISASPHLNPKLIASTGKYAFRGVEVGWTLPTAKDIVSIEWKRAAGTDGPGYVYPPIYVDGVAQEGFVPFSQNWLVLYKQSTGADGVINIRFVDSSGNASEWTYLSLASAFFTTSGTISVQDTDAVAISGIQTGAAGASDVRKVLCTYPVGMDVTLAGGSDTEIYDLNITSKGFGTRPDVGPIDCTSDDYTLVRYDAGTSYSTSTNARLVFSKKDGTNLAAGAYHIAGFLIEYD